MRSAPRLLFESFGELAGVLSREPEIRSRSELAGLTRTPASVLHWKSGPQRSRAEMVCAVPPSSVIQKKAEVFAPSSVWASDQLSRKLIGVGESCVGCVVEVAFAGRVQICQTEASDLRKAMREASGDQKGCLMRPWPSSENLPVVESKSWRLTS